MSDQRREFLQQLKHLPANAGAALVIPIGNPVVAYLRPVATGVKAIDKNDVTCLTNWRNRFVTAFLNEFEATERQTTYWLSNMVAADSTRILFMCDDLSGRTFGYMGLAYIDWDLSCGEADAIVRGEEAPKAGVMKEALLTLLRWAHGQLGLQHLGVRVRSDNPALGFYFHLGFEEVRRVPLARVVHSDRVEWCEQPDAQGGGLCLVHMRIAVDKLSPHGQGGVSG